MPRVSVIMAVYNLADEKVLGASIRSVLNQTFRDFELLICDDGSSDATPEILERFAKSDRRIKVIHHKKNWKAGHARNTCIKRAKGRYIAIMDADDISAPQRLEKLSNFLDGHPEYAFAGGRGEYFVSRIGDDGENCWYCQEPKPEDFLFSLPFVHASLMFRKEALEKVHRYDGSRKAVRAEDYDLLLRMYAKGMRGYNLDEVMYYCRRDERHYQRRKYRYRFCEAVVRYRGFQALGLMPKGILYTVKPLLVGMIPISLMKPLQKKYYRGKQFVASKQLSGKRGGYER